LLVVYDGLKEQTVRDVCDRLEEAQEFIPALQLAYSVHCRSNGLEICAFQNGGGALSPFGYRVLKVARFSDWGFVSLPTLPHPQPRSQFFFEGRGEQLTKKPLLPDRGGQDT
jgi:hypothetical protein